MHDQTHPADVARAMPCSVEQRAISVDAALRAVQAAVRQARLLGVRVNVAVVDCFGIPAAFARMPGAPLHSIDIAADKAYTAASFGLATSAWHAELASHSEAVRAGLTLRPRFVAFGGGVPIVEHGMRIGGIGVSGGSETQDETVALAGLASLGLAS